MAAVRGTGAVRMVVLALLSAGGIAWACLAYARPAERPLSPRSALSATAPQRNKQPPPESKPPDQKIAGKVLDRDGNAVAKVEVRFAGPKKERVWTDSHGDFSFTGPSGDYVVTIKVGEHNQEFKVKIQDDQLNPSTLIIDPEPFH